MSSFKQIYSIREFLFENQLNIFEKFQKIFFLKKIDVANFANQSSNTIITRKSRNTKIAFFIDRQTRIQKRIIERQNYKKLNKFKQFQTS